MGGDVALSNRVLAVGTPAWTRASSLFELEIRV
jgi:hypothetical protein